MDNVSTIYPSGMVMPQRATPPPAFRVPEPIVYLVDLGGDRWNLSGERPLTGRWLYRGTRAGAYAVIATYQQREAAVLTA